MIRSKRTDDIQLHRAEPAGPTQLPTGPEHCACGAWLEPLRRTAGKCRPCIAAQHTLQLMPSKPAPYPEDKPHHNPRVSNRGGAHPPRFQRPCWACGNGFLARRVVDITCSLKCRMARKAHIARAGRRGEQSRIRQLREAAMGKAVGG